MASALFWANSVRADPVATDLSTAAPGDGAFTVQGPDARGARTFRARLLFDYAKEPLVLITEDQRPYRVVGDAAWLQAALSFTLDHRWLFAVHAPLLLSASSEARPGSGEALPAALSPSLGDIRLALRARLLGPAGRGLQLGAGAELWLPTGADAGYGGDGAVRARGFLSTGAFYDRFYWSLEAGVYHRPEQQLPGILPMRLGPALSFGAATGFALDSRGAIRVGPEAQASSTFGGGAKLLDTRSSFVQFLIGARYRMQTLPLELGLGAGPAVGQGVGGADFRGILSLSWSPEEPPPPPDRDGDGVPDESDICLNLPGVRSDDPLMNGCPELPLDTDGDSIPDAFDACPRKPGEPTNDRRTHGCPKPPPEPPKPKPPEPPPPPAATLSEKAIEISEQVQFETGTAQLRPESDAILTQVAKVLGEHPELVLVEVQGHTDDTGTPELNRTLARDRAAAVVRWLVEHGIAASRLSGRGYGQDRPIADNASEEGRAKNRRVEFVILERGGAK